MKEIQFFCDLCHEWTPVKKCDLHFRNEHAWKPEHIAPELLAEYFIHMDIEFREVEVTNNE